MSAQTRWGSALEAAANILLGMLIAFGANLLVFPLFGLSPSVQDVAGITIILTVISFVRNYALRRFFEAIRVGSSAT